MARRIEVERVATPREPEYPVPRSEGDASTLESAGTGESGGSSAEGAGASDAAASATTPAQLAMQQKLAELRQIELLGIGDTIEGRQQSETLVAELGELAKVEAERLLSDPGVTDAERMGVLRQEALGGLPEGLADLGDSLADEVAANASAKFLALAGDPTASLSDMLGALRQREMLGGFGGDPQQERDAADALSGRIAAATGSGSGSDTPATTGSAGQPSRLPDMDGPLDTPAIDDTPSGGLDDPGTRLGRPQDDDPGGSGDAPGDVGGGSDAPEGGSSGDEWAPFPSGGSDPTAPPLVDGPAETPGYQPGAGDDGMQATEVRPGPGGWIWVPTPDGGQQGYDPYTGQPADAGPGAGGTGTGTDGDDSGDEGGTDTDDTDDADAGTDADDAGDSDADDADDEGDDEGDSDADDDADDDEMPSPNDDSGTSTAFDLVQGMTAARSGPADPLMDDKPPDYWVDKTPGAGEPRTLRPPTAPPDGINPIAQPTPDDSGAIDPHSAEIERFVEAMADGSAPPDPVFGDRPPEYWTDKTPAAGEPREIRPPTEPPGGINPIANATDASVGDSALGVAGAASLEGSVTADPTAPPTGSPGLEMPDTGAIGAPPAADSEEPMPGGEGEEDGLP